MMLALEPSGGLADRMRAIGSAVQLAEDIGAQLRIIWTRTPDLGCRFAELFEPLKGLRLIERSRWGNRLSRRAALYGRRYSRDLREPES